MIATLTFWNKTYGYLKEKRKEKNGRQRLRERRAE